MSSTQVIGNLTADPELRFTPSGAAVASFTVAETPRYFDNKTNKWEEGETLFMRCSVWNITAENVAESLQRGDRVICIGKLKQRSYETKEGEKRTVIEMTVDEIGPSLRFHIASPSKVERTSEKEAEPEPEPEPAPARTARTRAARGTSRRMASV
jgi:single-strand DNA-binding protein